MFPLDDALWKFTSVTVDDDCQIATESVRTVDDVTTPARFMKLMSVVDNSMHCTVIVVPAIVPLDDASRTAPRCNVELVYDMPLNCIADPVMYVEP